MGNISVADYNEDCDIDLSLDYQDDGEIVLNGDQPGAYIDNSYEATLGGLHVMPPPTNPNAPGAPPAMAAPVAASQPSQPFTFQVQVPPGVGAGTQLQVPHPQTGQMLIVPVPE